MVGDGRNPGGSLAGLGTYLGVLGRTSVPTAGTYAKGGEVGSTRLRSTVSWKVPRPSIYHRRTERICQLYRRNRTQEGVFLGRKGRRKKKERRKEKEEEE